MRARGLGSRKVLKTNRFSKLFGVRADFGNRSTNDEVSIFGRLGASWGRLEYILVRLGGVLEQSGGVLGSQGAGKSTSNENLLVFYTFWGAGGLRQSINKRLGKHLRASWGRLGYILVRLGGVLEQSGGSSWEPGG